MGTTIKHPVSDRVKTSFVIFDIRAPLWRSVIRQQWASMRHPFILSRLMCVQHVLRHILLTTLLIITF